MWSVSCFVNLLSRNIFVFISSLLVSHFLETNKKIGTLKVRWDHQKRYLKEMIRWFRIAASINNNYLERLYETVDNYDDIFNYQVLSVVTNEELKSLESYNYFYSSKVGYVFHNELSPDFIYLKVDMTQVSQWWKAQDLGFSKKIWCYQKSRMLLFGRRIMQSCRSCVMEGTYKYIFL